MGLGTSSLSIEGALPLLTAAYRTDRLVPFVGSGLSMPACRSWASLVLETLKLVGLTPDEAFAQPEVPREIITRQADEAMRLLRAMPRRDFLSHLQRALYADRDSIPPNSKALAAIRWPLIISTNYDDVLVRAIEGARNRNSEQRPLVVGRGPSDCHAVLRALDIPSPPILWAIQGYLHGRGGRTGDDLVSQMVLSHKQYQDAINNAPLFRRAFGEVFRRRTLLFVGSGILEDYLVNLFGEVVAQHGPPPRRHYALLRTSQLDRLDARFLADRLGIVPVVFQEYTEIAKALSDLADAVTTVGDDTASPLKGTSFAAIPSSVGYQIVVPGRTCLNVVVKSARLRRAQSAEPDAPVPGVLTAISVGRREGAILGGPMAEAVLGPEAVSILRDDFARSPDSEYVHTSKKWPVMAVAARDSVGVLDLALIPEAMDGCLRSAETLGARCVQVGLLSGGTAAPWHPVFSLIQMLSGIRDYCRRAQRQGDRAAGLEAVHLCLVDPRAWYPVVSQQIPIAELLSSELKTIFVDLQSDGGSDLFTHIVSERNCSLRAIQEYFNLDGHDWLVDLSPAHSDEIGGVPSEPQISSYSTVRIRFRTPESKHHPVPSR